MHMLVGRDELREYVLSVLEPLRELLEACDVVNIISISLLVLALVSHPRLVGPQQHLGVVEEIDLSELTQVRIQTHRLTK